MAGKHQDQPMPPESKTQEPHGQEFQSGESGHGEVRDDGHLYYAWCSESYPAGLRLAKALLRQRMQKQKGNQAGVEQP